MSTILASSLIASLTLCPRPVTPINKGDLAPCEGYLFSPEKEQELRIKNGNYKLLEQEVEIYKTKTNNLNEQINNYEFIIKKEQEKTDKWRTTAENITEKYIQHNNSVDSYIVMWVLSGVLLTVASGWTVGQVSK